MKAAASELRTKAEKKGTSFVKTQNGKKSSSYHDSYWKIAQAENLRSICVHFLGPLEKKYYKLGCLSHPEMYSFTVLETRSSRSKCWQGWFPLRAVRKNLLHAAWLASGGLLPIFGDPWLVNISPRSPPSCSHAVLPVYMCLNFSL